MSLAWSIVDKNNLLFTGNFQLTTIPGVIKREQFQQHHFKLGETSLRAWHSALGKFICIYFLALKSITMRVNRYSLGAMLFSSAYSSSV